MACKIIIGILFLLFVDLIYCHHKMDKNRLIKSFQHLITTLLLPFKMRNCCKIYSTDICHGSFCKRCIYLKVVPFM